MKYLSFFLICLVWFSCQSYSQKENLPYLEDIQIKEMNQLLSIDWTIANMDRYVQTRIKSELIIMDEDKNVLLSKKIPAHIRSVYWKEYSKQNNYLLTIQIFIMEIPLDKKTVFIGKNKNNIFYQYLRRTIDHPDLPYDSKTLTEYQAKMKQEYFLSETQDTIPLTQVDTPTEIYNNPYTHELKPYVYPIDNHLPSFFQGKKVYFYDIYSFFILLNSTRQEISTEDLLNKPYAPLKYLMTDFSLQYPKNQKERLPYSSDESELFELNQLNDKEVFFSKAKNQKSQVLIALASDEIKNTDRPIIDNFSNELSEELNESNQTEESSAEEILNQSQKKIQKISNLYLYEEFLNAYDGTENSLDSEDLTQNEEAIVFRDKRIKIALNRLLLKNANTDIYPSSFIHFRMLDLSNSGIQYLDDLEKLNFPNLYYLNLSSNPLKVFNHKVFSQMPNLSYLSLANTQIKRLLFNVFILLPELKGLYLQKNFISQLPRNIFSRQTKLLSLDLSDNMIKQLANLSISSLTQLKSLNLNGNLLSSIPNNFFISLPNLEYLLMINPIRSLYMKSFFNLDNLRYIEIPKAILKTQSFLHLLKSKKDKPYQFNVRYD